MVLKWQQRHITPLLWPSFLWAVLVCFTATAFIHLVVYPHRERAEQRPCGRERDMGRMGPEMVGGEVKGQT